MEKAGCARIVVVVGHGKDDVIAGLAGYRGASEIIFADNPRHDLAMASRSWRRGRSVPGDFCARHDRSCRRRRSHRPWRADTAPAPGTAVLLVDYKLDTIFDDG